MKANNDYPKKAKTTETFKEDLTDKKKSEKLLAGVYMIRNKVNKRVYIGQSKNCEARRRSHFWDLKNKFHKNREMQEDYDKYGHNAFEFKILCLVPTDTSDEERCQLEDQYIIKYKAMEKGYNNVIGGSKYHPDQYKLCVELLKQGLTPAEVSRLTNIGHTTIWKYKKKLVSLGQISERSLNLIPASVEKKAKKMIKEGKKNKDIVAACGINKGTVIKLKKEMGADIKNPHTVAQLKALVPAIKELLMQNYIVKDIANLFKVSTQFISDVRVSMVLDGKIKGRKQDEDYKPKK